MLVAGVALLPVILGSAELSDTDPAAPGVIGIGVYDTYTGTGTFNFRARQAGGGSNLGYFSLCDDNAGVCMTKGTISSLSIIANAATFRGSGQLDDGTQVSFNVNVQDGSPDVPDVFSVKMTNGYKASSVVVSGDIRVSD